MGKRARWFAAAAAGVAGCLVAARPCAAQTCVGDCDGDGTVSIAELITGVNMALGNAPVDDCPAFDALADRQVTINELIEGVANASRGCPGPEEFVAQASDFQCLTDWDKVRHFRITNRLGHLDEALAVAHGEQSVPYPIGTIIQLVPAEAMVKRGSSFRPRERQLGVFRHRRIERRDEDHPARPPGGGQRRAALLLLSQRRARLRLHLRERPRLHQAAVDRRAHRRTAVERSALPLSAAPLSADLFLHLFRKVEALDL